MYVDGFVIAVPKDKIEEYKAMARMGAEVWREHGATSYIECLADDVPYGELTSFPRAVHAKENEMVVFSWITYPSKEVRDACNKKAMEDPRMKAMDPTKLPFDGKRMIVGGFETILES